MVRRESDPESAWPATDSSIELSVEFGRTLLRPPSCTVGPAPNCRRVRCQSIDPGCHSGEGRAGPANLDRWFQQQPRPHGVLLCPVRQGTLNRHPRVGGIVWMCRIVTGHDVKVPHGLDDRVQSNRGPPHDEMRVRGRVMGAGVRSPPQRWSRTPAVRGVLICGCQTKRQERLEASLRLG